MPIGIAEGSTRRRSVFLIVTWIDHAPGCRYSKLELLVSKDQAIVDSTSLAPPRVDRCRLRVEEWERRESPLSLDGSGRRVMPVAQAANSDDLQEWIRGREDVRSDNEKRTAWPPDHMGWGTNSLRSTPTRFGVRHAVWSRHLTGMNPNAAYPQHSWGVCLCICCLTQAR